MSRSTSDAAHQARELAANTSKDLMEKGLFEKLRFILTKTGVYSIVFFMRLDIEFLKRAVRRFCWILFVFIFVFVMPLAVHAQWMTQTIELKQGWNAIWLTLQPVPASCDVVFEGVEVERVSMWDRSKGGVEYLTDPIENLPLSSDWLMWRPVNDPQARLNTFVGMLAGKSYLVKMREPATLSIKGRAVLVHPEWIPNAMTLTGLPTAGETSFADWFSHVEEIGVDNVDGGGIYEVLTDGLEMPTYRPSLVDAVPGKAYWVTTGQTLAYDGPLEVTLSDGADYFDFGAKTNVRKLRLRNLTDAPRTVTIELLESQVPPNDHYSTSISNVPLSMVVMNFKTLRNEYRPMPDTLTTNVAVNSTVEIALIPRANEMISEDRNAVWESVLRVSDGEVVQHIGIQCTQKEPLAPPTGLWVGSVVVDAVSRAPSRVGATNVWNTVDPVPVSQPYSFRVLIHISSDSNNTCRLLQRALPAWLPSEDGQEPDTYIFIDTEDARQFKNDKTDVQIARISSANFPLMDPVEMSGEFGSTNGLSCRVVLPYNDSVNPFVHAFHPDHDNKKYDNNGTASPLLPGDESFNVTRDLTFTFSEEDPLGVNPNWRVSEHGGVFEETVGGLNKTIYVKGVFRLEKVSDCGVLSYLDQY